ncbi:MAG TPA: tRNA (adenosine(37)-N6)-threonylcarbamoyltransferase complex ATPase subunit type 1 TsaE [Acidimicrobiales bacterium]|jgi:tRNA threonylcarbamoyladenosine biosynthesis protein TsaE
MTRRTTVTCRSVAETEQVAAALAAVAAPGQVLVLAGGLGAGKTTFVKAYAAALGVTAPVTSPTYTLVHEYPCALGGPVRVLAHADLWRLRDVSEIQDLGLDELVAEGAVALVEWGDRFESSLPGDHVVVTFSVLGPTARELAVDLLSSGIDDDALTAIDAR